MKKAVMQAGICSLIASTHLFSNPMGPHVTSGDVSVDISDVHNMHVDSRSKRSIITWDSFSIESSESTYFHLPDSSSAVLNKVSSNLSSTLAGLLESNGHVYLLNPNGVLVTKEGVINTASFLASTLDVNNDFFLEGQDLLFAGASQESVINQGKITSWQGDVVLLGLVVRNEGEINAVNGIAALGAGTEILLTPHADYRIAIQVSVADLGHGDVGIAQEGIITALQAELKTSGNAYALAIHNSGKINATSFEKTAGRVYLIADKGLVSHTGTITAIGTDTAGGDVQILGERVSLTEGALVDVSGVFGGGSIFVGGDYRGVNPLINHAAHTFIEAGVVLAADALESGSGGKVIVWGIESNQFFGFVSAQGGSVTGSGGFVEVSSVHNLEYRGLTNTLATNGSSGVLLLDPTSINIITGGSGLNLGEPNCFANTYCGGGTNMAALSIDPATIIAALSLSSIMIDASAGSASGTGSITITNGFTTPANGNSLTLVALENVIINDNVTHAGTGVLNIYAGSFNTGMGVVTSNVGTITVAAAKTLKASSSGNIFLTAHTTSSDCIIINGILNTSSSGAITATTLGGGNVHFQNGSLLTSSGSGGSALLSAGTITFDALSNINFTSGSGDLNMSGTDIDIICPITFAPGTSGSLELSSQGAISFRGIMTYDSTGGSAIAATTLVLMDNVFTIGDPAMKEFNISAGTAITFSDTVNVNASSPVLGVGTYTLNVSSTAGNIDFNANVNITEASSLFLDAPTINFLGLSTATFNTTEPVVIQSGGGSNATFFGDGSNVYVFNNEGFGTFNIGGGTVVLRDLCSVEWFFGTSTLNSSADFFANQGSTISFDVGAGGFHLSSGCDFAGIVHYHTSSAFSATSSGPALIVDTTAEMIFDGGSIITFAGTGSDGIQLNNQGMNSFLVLNGSTLVISETTGPISMGMMARIDYVSTQNLSISTTNSGSISFDGTSLINFSPTIAGKSLSITSVNGDVNVGDIIYAAQTGICTISSTNGSVGLNVGGLLNWSSPVAGALKFSGGSGVAINGNINYSSINPLSMTTTVAGTIFQANTSTILINPGAGSLNLNAVNTVGLNAVDIAGTIHYGALQDLNFNVTSGNVLLESTANLVMIAGAGDLNIGTIGSPIAGTIESLGVITYSSGILSNGISMFAMQQITPGNIFITDNSTNMITSTTSDIVTDSGTTINAISGTLTMNAPLGEITTNGTLSFAGGTLTLNAQNDINIVGATSITGISKLIVTTSLGDININNSLFVNSSLLVGIQLTALAGDVNMNVTGSFTGGTFIVNSVQDVIIDSPLNFNGDSNFFITSSQGTIYLNDSVSLNSTNIIASQFTAPLGRVEINGSITYLGLTNRNPLTISAASGIDINGSFSYESSGLCTLISAMGDINFNSDITFPVGGTGGLIATANQNISIGNVPFVFDSSGDCIFRATTGTMFVNGFVSLDTGGKLEMHAGQDLFCVNEITNIAAGPMLFSATDLFRIEPVFGSGSITSARGDITIGGIAGPTGMIMIRGDSSPASIMSNGGNISITSTGDAILFDNVSIDSGTGSYTLHIGGALNLLAAANTIIKGISGVVSVTDNLLLLSDSGGSSQITAVNDVAITSANSIYLIGFPNAANTSSISSSGGGNVSVTTTGGAGTIEVRDLASITTNGIGTIILASVGDIIVDNSSTISASGSGSIAIGTVGIPIGGNLRVFGGTSGSSSVSAGTGGLSIFTIDSIVMGGASLVNQGSIIAMGGPYTLSAHQSILMNPFATASLNSGTFNFTLVALQSMIMAGSTVLNNGSTGLSSITIADGNFMAGAEGPTSITMGTGAFFMNSTNKISFISAGVNLFSLLTGGNTTLKSTANSVSLRGSPSAVVEVLVGGTLSLSASQNIDILNNTIVTSVGDMTLTTTDGDLALLNVESINAGGLLTVITGGDISLKSSEGVDSTSLTGGTGVVLNVTGDFYVAGARGDMTVTAITGDLNVTARNCFLTGSLAVRPVLSATAGDVVFGVTNQMTLDYTMVFAGSPSGNVGVTVANANLALMNGSEINSFGTGFTTCIVLNGAIYVEAGPTLRSVISGGSGGASLQADRVIMDAHAPGIANSAQIFTTGSLTVIANTLFAMDKASSVVASGAAPLNIAVATGDFICNRNSMVTQTGTGALTINAPLGNVIISGGGGDSKITTTSGTLRIVGSKINMLSGQTPGSAIVSSFGNVILTGSDQITLSGSVGSPAFVTTTLGTLTINASKDLRVLDNSLISITGVANIKALHVNVTGDLIVSNQGSITHSGTGIITSIPNIGGNLVVKGGPLGNSVINVTGGTLSFTVLGNINLESVSTGTARVTSQGSLVLVGNNIYSNGYSLLMVSQPAQIASTNGPLLLTANNDLILQNNSQVIIAAGALVLQANAITGNLIVSNNSFIGHQGTGPFFSTVGANAHIFGGPLGDGLISVNGDLTFTVAGLLDIQAGSGFQGKVLSNGLTLITAGSVNMLGESTIARALLENASGNMTINAGLTALNAHATLSLTAGIGNMQMTLTDSLMVANDSTIQNSGTGATTILIDGSVTFFAGSGNARLFGSTGVLTLTATDNLQLLASENGVASITSSGQVNVLSANNVSLLGSIAGSRMALIQTTANALSVTGGQNVVLLNNARIATTGGAGTMSVNATLGNLTLDNQASIQHAGTGTISCIVGKDVVINAGLNGNAFVQANAAGLNLAFTGALTIQSLSNNNGYIQAAGTSSMSAGKISMIGFSKTVPAFIQNSSGNLTVSADSITMVDFAQVKLTGGLGILVVNTTNGDLKISNSSLIQNLGTGPTSSMVNKSLYIEGGIGGASSFLGGNGGLNIAVGSAIQLSGFTSAFNAVISTVQGGLTISSGQGTSLNPHASITISNVGAAGPLQLIVGNDLLVMNDSIIRHFGTGSTTINVAGVANILAGSDDATIQGGSGAMSLIAVDNISIFSNTVGVASIQSAGHLSVSTMGDISIVGSPFGIQKSFIQTGSIANPTLSISSNNLAVRNGGEIVLTAGSGTFFVTCLELLIENNACLQQQGTGSFVSTIGGDCILRGGSGGPATILSHSPLNLMIGGDLKIEADANSLASISSQGTTSISANRIYMIGFSSTFNAGISNSTGNLTVSAATINLIDFCRIQLTGGSGMMTVNTTSGDLRIANASFVKNLGTGQLVSTVNKTFYIEGGSGGKASYTSGSGGINATANALSMTGFSTGNSALISATTGNITLVTTTMMDLDSFATVSITDPLGRGILNVLVGTDLLVTNGSTMMNAGLGATIVGVTGVATFLGGAGDSSLIGNAGTLSLTVGDNLHIISDVLGRAYIVNAGSIMVTAGYDVHIIGAPEAHLTSSIQTSVGTLSIVAVKNIIIEDQSSIAITAGSGTLSVTTAIGDLFVENDSSIQQKGSGGILATIGGSAIIRSGSSGNGFISNNSALNLNVNKDLLIEDVQGLQAYIASNGATSISSNRLFMFGSDATHQAYIQNGSGNLIVSGTSIRMLDFAKIRISGGSGTLTVQATAGELRLANGSFIQHSGTGSTVATATKALYLEGGTSGASSIQGGAGGLSASAESILMNGYSATNNAVISAADGALNVTTTGSSSLGRLSMMPHSKIVLNAGSGDVTVTVGGDFYKIGGPTISTNGTGAVNATATTCSCP